jgi:chitinase
MSRAFMIRSLVVPCVIVLAGCGSGSSSSNDATDSGPLSDDGGQGGQEDSPSTGDAGAADTSSSGDSATPHDSGSTGHDAAHDGAGVTDAADGGAIAAIDYAPYFPTWTWGAGSGYAYTSLVDLQQKANLNEVTIAFVLSGGGCSADQGIEQNLSDVQAFVAAGGHVKASFGGADGTYVESGCSDAASWASAIEAFVDATGITDLDFDIEQDPVLTDAVNAMRGQALALVQASRHVKVAFTLGANPHTNGSPGGLTTQGLSVVTHAVSAGVVISHVNLMTMDYGDSFGGQPIAPVAIGSLTDAQAQLLSAIPGLTPDQAWSMLGVIPMIGKNDDAEVFSVDDAKAVAAFAVQNRLGLVSFWSIDRDQVCPQGANYNSCSTVDPTNFAFDQVFQTVTQ